MDGEVAQIAEIWVVGMGSPRMAAMVCQRDKSVRTISSKEDGRVRYMQLIE